ncbi:hypothetical protein CK203_026501 [Vitis vinifera]|uniref:Retrotransposon Copia-like N-terminal domain-containing protein n=1 Tax=Vitis vinifera TaxID=29760 RepID=A0A438IVU9_VITVI|nr:hypothetical protein CK203_026501 [Vitis vinifera]
MAPSGDESFLKGRSLQSLFHSPFRSPRAMILALNSKNKLGFVNGSIKAPLEETDPEGYATWSWCNEVHSWIVNTLNPEIVNSVIYYSTTHEVWEDLHEQILLMNPLSFVRQAYSSVSQEEKQRLLTSMNATAESTSSAAMAIHSNDKSSVTWKDGIDRSNTGRMEPIDRPSDKGRPTVALLEAQLKQLLSFLNNQDEDSSSKANVDLATRRTIGLGKQCDGLYYLVALATEKSLTNRSSPTNLQSRHLFDQSLA